MENIKRPSIILGKDGNSLIYLIDGEYDNLVSIKDRYEDICKVSSMSTELVEVSDEEELELLRNDLSMIQEKFSYLIK